MKTFVGLLNLLAVYMAFELIYRGQRNLITLFLLVVLCLSTYCVFYNGKKLLNNVVVIINSFLVFGGLLYLFLMFRNGVEVKLDKIFFGQLLILFMMLGRPILTVMVVNKKIEGQNKKGRDSNTNNTEQYRENSNNTKGNTKDSHL